MSISIMSLLIIAVIYFAFSYLKGSRNTDTYRNTFDMRHFNGDTWNDETPPELSENDEIEMETDGEDMEEIGFDPDEPEDVQESEFPAAELPEEPVVQAMSTAHEAPAIPSELAATRSAAPAIPSEREAAQSAAPAIPSEREAAQSAVPPSPVVPSAPPVQLEAPSADGVVIDSEVMIDAEMPSDNNN